MSFNWFFSTYTVFFIPKDKTCLQGIISLTALPGKNTLEILRIFSINVSLDYSVMSEVWECSDPPFYRGNPIPTLCYCMRYFNNLHTIFPLFPSLRSTYYSNPLYCQQAKIPVKHIFLVSVHDSLMPREGKGKKLRQAAFLFCYSGWLHFKNRQKCHFMVQQFLANIS